MNRRLLTTCVTLSLLGGVAGGELRAQTASHDAVWTNHRLAVEGFYSQYRLDNRSGGDRMSVDGVGGRLMWQLPSLSGLASESYTRPRAAVGAFAVYTPKQDVGFTTWHMGAQGDLLPFASPILGRIDPIVSLGAGAFRMNEREREIGGVRTLAIDLPGARRLLQLQAPAASEDRTTTSFALSPAVGLRFALLPNAGLRADARDVIAFRNGTTHNYELSAGLSLAF